MPSPLLATYPPFPIEIERAEGCELIATDGRRYLDLYGGHCVCLLGHNPPTVVEAIKRQMERICFYSTALHLPERDQAAYDLLAIAPSGFDRVFFVNSGAEANENALKLACAHTERAVIVAIDGAFHGRTAAADSVTGGPSRKIHYPRAPFEVRWVGFGDAVGLEAALTPGDVAAVILEPVQSTAGCRVHPPEFVATLNRVAPATGTLVIADEVQGGYARCIELWSHQAIGLNADLITTAKGLGAGFPTGALLVHSRFPEPKGGLFGSTFGGGPIASAVMSVVCKTVADPAFAQHVGAVSAIVDRLAEIPGVAELQGIGLLRGVRISDPSSDPVGSRAKRLKQQLLESGVLVGGSNDPQVLRLLPPLTLSTDQAEGFVRLVAELIAK